jgi:hypothetical protein
MQGLQTLARLNRAAADAKARRATTPPRRFEDFYVFGDKSQIILDTSTELTPSRLPLLVVTIVRGGEKQVFLAYRRTADDNAAAYHGDRNEVLAVLRDLGVKDGAKLLDESFGVEA